MQFGEVQRVLGFFLLGRVETLGNQWAGAQFGGVSLAHASQEKSGRVHIFKRPLPVSKDFRSRNSGPMLLNYLAPTKIPKPHHATSDSRLEPVSPTFPPTFRPRFGMGPFSVSDATLAWSLPQFPGIYSLGNGFKDLRQFQASLRTLGAQNFTIQATLGTAAWISGSLSA